MGIGISLVQAEFNPAESGYFRSYWRTTGAPVAHVDRADLQRKGLGGRWFPRYDQFVALTPSEKLDLIKSSATVLAKESWTDIEVTFAVFGISGIGGEWSDLYDYVAQSLSGASEDALIGLHAHLNDEVPLATASTQLGPWQKDHFRLFFSHTHPNKKLAAEIRTDLLDKGVDLFVAHEMIEPTKEWMEEISVALATCDAMVALLTSDFADSSYCDQELGFALSRDVLVIPIRHGADPHGFISKFQALPGDTSQLASHNLAGASFRSWLPVRRRLPSSRLR